MYESEQKSSINKKPNLFAKILLEVVDLVSFFIMALWVVFFIRLFIFSPFTVVGQSMEPALHEMDFLIIDKVSGLQNKLYTTSWTSNAITRALPDIKRWDIIVFIPPQEIEDGKHLVKRIIWLPWETVKLEWGKVYICNTNKECNLLDEPYLAKDKETLSDRGISSFKIENGYFVMWDNRDHSTDSRSCFMGVGCYEGYSYVVPYQNVIGRVRLRLSPNYNKF